jgi:uncharacterized protein YdaU (DUF1376 family)
MNYYSHHIGDYLTATAHLSILEDGCYRRMMDRYYTTELPLPSDEQALFRLLRARSEDEKEAVRVVLDEFFTLTESGWSHKRCEEEISQYKDKSGKAADAANKRWNKGCNANAMPTHSERNTDAMLTNNQEPITNNQEPIKDITPSAKAPKFDFAGKLSALGADDKSIRDWLAVRKVKRAANTETVIESLVREAAKAQISVADAVLLCATRSWQGFEADWLKPKAQAAPQRPSAHNGFENKDYAKGVNADGSF